MEASEDLWRLLGNNPFCMAVNIPVIGERKRENVGKGLDES
jgi:hypothetical protein